MIGKVEKYICKISPSPGRKGRGWNYDVFLRGWKLSGEDDRLPFLLLCFLFSALIIKNQRWAKLLSKVTLMKP
jgi:hypothetical protein